MRIILIGTILMFMQIQCIAQERVLEFIPAVEKYFPFINSYSDNDGFNQYYLEDSKWVHNKLIPNFTNADNLKDISIQYFTENDGSAPQLFVYSQSAGDFKFYFLTNDGWVLNENIPTGRIGIGSSNIHASYSPPQPNKSGFIFSYSSESQNIELLVISENRWSNSEYFPSALPK